MTDGTGDPWAGTTYNGFSGGPPPSEPPPPTVVRRRASGRLIGAGVAAAVVLGVGFGLLTRSDMGEEPPPPDRARTVQTSSASVPIEIAAVAPTPLPAKASAPMEVLPPDMARAAAAAPVIRAPSQVAPPQRMAQVALAPPAVSAAARVTEPSAPLAEPSFDCRYGGSPAERMVCGDPELARLDRRLNRAFEQAIASGAPRRSLRQDQDDWLNIREDAARQAGEAGVASVYRQRIAELNDLARDGNAPY